MNILVPKPGGLYDPNDPFGESTPLADDVAYLLDADSHSRDLGWLGWSARSDVLIRIITDDGSPA